MHFLFADLEQQVTSLALKTVAYASLVMVVCVLLAALLKHRGNRVKIPLFAVMATTLVGSALLLFGSTIYLNTKAESKGPVHWHADIEFWACGSEVELRNPHGTLSNKIGTATYHEHNDKRIHLEGVVVKKSEDASLGKFMRVTDGFLQDDAIAIPLNDDQAEWFVSGDQIDGDKQSFANAEQLKRYVKQADKGPVMQLTSSQSCGDQRGELQVFVYSYNKQDKTYKQTKLGRPTDYVMRDESVVPPGDCVIVEFDKSKPKTDKLCRQYGVRDSSRCVDFGVKKHDPELCNIRETN